MTNGELLYSQRTSNKMAKPPTSRIILIYSFNYEAGRVAAYIERRFIQVKMITYTELDLIKQTSMDARNLDKYGGCLVRHLWREYSLLEGRIHAGMTDPGSKRPM